MVLESVRCTRNVWVPYPANRPGTLSTLWGVLSVRTLALSPCPQPRQQPCGVTTTPTTTPRAHHNRCVVRHNTALHFVDGATCQRHRSVVRMQLVGADSKGLSQHADTHTHMRDRACTAKTCSTHPSTGTTIRQSMSTLTTCKKKTSPHLIWLGWAATHGGKPKTGGKGTDRQLSFDTLPSGHIGLLPAL